MTKNWADALGLDDDRPSEEEFLAQYSDPVQDASFNPVEVEELSRKSLDFLAALAMPTVFRYFFPPVFHQIWEFLCTHVHKERDFSRLAIGFPRGFAKTTFVKIFLLYAILFSKRKFIMVCAHSQEKAELIVADVIGFLEQPNVKAVFGDWKVAVETANATVKNFSFRGRHIVVRAGTVATIRGINQNHERPDLMLFDDIQSRQDADSAVVTQQLETDFLGTAMKAKSPHGCLFIFIANMYPTKHSLLKKLKKDPTWLKFIVGGILADGTSLWEDLQPLKQLLVEYQSDLASGRPEVFFAEVLNDENASINSFVDISKIPAVPYASDDLPQGSFIIIDPATNKANADEITIAYAEVFDAKPVYREIIEGRFSQTNTCKTAIKLALKRGCGLIAIESNAYQYALCERMQEVLEELGVEGIHVVDVYSGNRSKNSRILDMFKSLMAGDIYIDENVKSQVIAQIVPFNSMRTDNTDGVLDCLTYGLKVIDLYAPLIATQMQLILENATEIPVLDYTHTSEF